MQRSFQNSKCSDVIFKFWETFFLTFVIFVKLSTFDINFRNIASLRLTRVFSRNIQNVLFQTDSAQRASSTEMYGTGSPETQLQLDERDIDVFLEVMMA